MVPVPFVLASLLALTSTLTPARGGAVTAHFTGLTAPPFPAGSVLTSFVHPVPRHLDQIAVSSGLGRRRLTLFFTGSGTPLAVHRVMVVGQGSALRPGGDVTVQYTDDNDDAHIWDSSGGQLRVVALGTTTMTIEGQGIQMVGRGVTPFTLDFILRFDRITFQK